MQGSVSRKKSHEKDSIAFLESFHNNQTQACGSESLSPYFASSEEDVMYISDRSSEYSETPRLLEGDDVLEDEDYAELDEEYSDEDIFADEYEDYFEFEDNGDFDDFEGERS
jgi:hypothetical protein